MFTAFNDGIFHFATNFRESDLPVWQGLLIPPAWSLGLEITFYLISPFILKNRRALVILLAASLAIKLYLQIIGLGQKDPWKYRFFPAELSFFLLGALSHQLLKPYYQARGLITNQSSYLVSCVIFAFCFSLFMLPQKVYFAAALVPMFILSLPFLFHFQSHKKWDRAVGELSYPIYITHWLIITVFGGKILLPLGIENDSLIAAIIIVITTILVSYTINLTVGRFFESVRSKVKLNQNQN